MKTFDYSRADSPEAAVQGGAVGNTRFIAGGTNLLDLMKLQIETPERIVDISRLDLNEVEEGEDGGLRIGAMVPNADLAANPLVTARYPVLSRALLAGASGQLRNKASTGGNFLQRTRCYYFYDTAVPCNKREPGSGCPAKDGFNRIHAILGTSDECIASHPSDMAVAMRLLDAQVDTVDATGARRAIPIADFHLLPGDTPHKETVLKAGEIITSVTLPGPIGGTHVYRKVRDRASYAFALVSVAAIFGKDGTARFAFGGIGAKPWRTAEGDAAAAQGAQAVAEATLAGARTTHDNDFKRPLVEKTLASLYRQQEARA